MSGLLIIIVYLFFWWFCYVLSKSTFDEKAPRVEIKRFGVFLACAAIPFYFYVYDYTRYELTCSNIDTFFPQEKIENPSVLIFNDDSNAKLYSKQYSGFMVAPRKWGQWLTDLGKPITKQEMKTTKDYAIYSKGELQSHLAKEERETLIDKAKYGVFRFSIDVTSFVGLSNHYVHDFEKRKKVANIGSAIGAPSQNNPIRNYLLPYSFEHCHIVGAKFNTLLVNTFNKWQ